MRLLAIPLLLAVLVACVEDVGKDRVKAQVADVPTTEAPAPPVASDDATLYVVDLAQSSIQAVGAKITAEHPIDFPAFRGKLAVTEGTLSRVSFEVDMAALQADVPKLTTHLLDADFFDVAQFPQATFTSTAIVKGSETPDTTHMVTGDFTIHGVTKRITFPAKVAVGDDAVQARTEFVIDRKDFGIVYPGRPDDLVQDNVRMSIVLVAPKA